MSEGSRAVFLSYASEDAPQARRIAEALRSAGIEVWIDQSELRGGDAWDREIQAQIKSCELFVPLISANAHARAEGYFRLEWKLAVDRSHRMAPDRAYLLPVALDDTPQSDSRIPESFRELQWSRLSPETDLAPFVERIQVLLAAGADARDASAAAPSAAPAPIEAGDNRTRGRRPDTTLAPPATDRSIAVLPFVDLSEKHDQEYFGDGLAEELLDLLAKTPGLRVIARTSSFSFKGKAATASDIGRALKVANILEGSVRKSGPHLRIRTQLIRAESGEHIWSETYDRDAADVFAVQSDIARAVTARLRVTLLGSTAATHSHPVNPQAHEFYLRALFNAALDTRDGIEQAIADYRRALGVDPEFATAWSALAFAHVRQIAHGFAPVAATQDEAMRAAQKSVALDPNLANGHAIIGFIRFARDLDWEGARDAVDRAVALDPNQSHAMIWRALLAMLAGRADEAIQYCRRAIACDPFNLLNRRYFSRVLYFAGQLEEAEATARGVVQASPTYPGAHYELGRVLLARGQAAEALAAFEAEPLSSIWRTYGLPLAYRNAGRDAEAAAALQEVVRNSAGSEFQVAETYAHFGDLERTFYWLDQAVERRDAGLLWVRGNPLLHAASRDPRYAALLRRLKLPT